MKTLDMTALVTASIALLVSGFQASANPMIYPAKGQSQAQQDKDRYECHTWAVKQTGFDPSNPPPTPPTATTPERGGALRGAAGGAAVGAVAGAIAGDAGKGAAAGAAGGAVLGGIRQNARNRKAAKEAGQEQAVVSAERSEYDRALGACMEGRGYTVK